MKVYIIGLLFLLIIIVIIQFVLLKINVLLIEFFHLFLMLDSLFLYEELNVVKEAKEICELLDSLIIVNIVSCLLGLTKLDCCYRI
jgi:hypothetical protein